MSHTSPTSQQQHPASPTLDAILAAITRDATIAYPAETARILRGMAIVVDDGIVHTDGIYWVQSQTHEDRQYRVNGICTCYDASRAPEGRCKHRWAKALYVKMRRALAAAAPTVTDTAPVYYATWYPKADDLNGQQGTATQDGSRWTFTPEGSMARLTVKAQDLVLGGRVDLCAAQRERDGESLGTKFGQPQYPQY